MVRALAYGTKGQGCVPGVDLLPSASRLLAGGNQSIDVSPSHQSFRPAPSFHCLKINWNKYPWGGLKKLRKNSMPLLNLTTVEATLHSQPDIHYIQIYIATQP